MIKNRIWSSVLILFFLLGCQKASNNLSTKRIATTNTYLESAAVDLLGHDVQIVRLAEPGMCPGSIDVRPSQVTELQQCRALLRFDFQKSLDVKLRPSDTNSFKIVAVSVHGGLCEPESYLAACRQLADAFVSLDWLGRDKANVKLNEISERLKAKETWAKRQMDQSGLNGRAVVASHSQKAF
jgi:ABC-type Zn uptake system ZnuABC Zn-binding protein ZnuA